MIFSVFLMIFASEAFPNRYQKFLNHHKIPKKESLREIKLAIRREGFERYHRNKKFLTSSIKKPKNNQSDEYLAKILAVERFNQESCNPQTCHKCTLYIRNPFSTNLAPQAVLTDFCFEVLERPNCCQKFNRRVGF